MNLMAGAEPEFMRLQQEDSTQDSCRMRGLPGKNLDDGTVRGLIATRILTPIS